MITKRRRKAVALAGAAVGLVVVGAAVGLGAPAGQPEVDKTTSKATDAKPKIDPQADAALKKMSTFMGKQQRFSVHTEGGLEVVLADGQKLEFPFQSDVKVQRPNMLRADRRGAKTDLRLYYDGKNVTLHGAILNMYATAAAPPDLDGTIDFARDELGLDAPGADLLYTDAYKGLMQDTVSALYLGPEDVHGTTCDHVAFRGKEVDFQVWIRSGDTPTPCRYIVTTTTIKSQPQYTVELSDWDLSPTFDTDVFTFVPPPGAEKIDFLTAKDMQQARKNQVTKPATR